MTIQYTHEGFTLIEMLTVVAVIGILAAISITSYRLYIEDAQSNSCLLEAKSYSNHVFVVINNQDDSTSPIAPVKSACHSITNARDWTIETQQKIIAIAKPPSNSRIECDIPNGSPCRIMP